jgi:hypothetical protein
MGTSRRVMSTRRMQTLIVNTSPTSRKDPLDRRNTKERSGTSHERHDLFPLPTKIGRMIENTRRSSKATTYPPTLTIPIPTPVPVPRNKPKRCANSLGKLIPGHLYTISNRIHCIEGRRLLKGSKFVLVLVLIHTEEWEVGDVMGKVEADNRI